VDWSRHGRDPSSRPGLVGLDELDFRDHVRWNEAKNVDGLDEPSLEND
jgi:hypothetical protein